MELTLGSETSAFKTQTPGNNPEDCILHSQHSKSLKSTDSSLADGTVILKQAVTKSK
jgi:hypothetical protein